MSASSASRLLYFFTYNPSLGGELNPHDKILFFHSASERSIDARNQLVGLSEALVNFALSFTGDVPCECVRTNQKVFCIRQFDDEVWTVVVAKDPLAGKGALDPPPYEADLFAEFLGNTVDLYHDTFKVRRDLCLVVFSFIS